MKELLSIIIPVYNGASSIEKLVQDLVLTLSKDPRFNIEIILVNDFSSDDSWEKIRSIQNAFPSDVAGLNLAKNFGEHNAVIAGYCAAKGDYIVNIDDDFQNPPSEIIKMYNKIKEGHHVVYSFYKKKKHSIFRNAGSHLTNYLATIMLKKPRDLYLSSFRIIRADLKEEILRYQGPFPYIDGLILRSTSRIAKVEVEHHDRAEGNSNYTIIKLLRLWSYMFLNFSTYPLRVGSLLGFVFALLGICGAALVIIEKIIYPETQVGWSSLIVALFILSGVQLIILGLIGEYIGRTFITQSNRPPFYIFEVRDQRHD